MAMKPKKKWIVKPHTATKHEIYSKYLLAWSIILARSTVAKHGRNAHLHLFDGFAGAGYYDDGKQGSPLHALRAVTEHSRWEEFLKCPLEFVFVENNPENCAKLQDAVRGFLSQLPSEKRRVIADCSVIRGDCTEEAQRFLAHEEIGSVYPSFFLLDQFGYSSVPLSLISQIMARDRHEALVYMNWQRMHPYLEDPTKADACD